MNKEYKTIKSPQRLNSFSAVRRFCRWEIFLTLLAGCACRDAAHPPTLAGNEAAGSKLVRVSTRCEGGVTRIFVENNERTEITMSFDFDLTNLKSSAELPFTATFAPQQTTEAFSVVPLDPDAAWHYTFTNYHHLGSKESVHDDSYLYSLPYAPGRAYRISQGYEGKYSHVGPNRYAIDWRMPEGTPVHAARGGLIVKAQDHSDIGGPDRKYDRFNNFILIRHDDGTLGHYCHLQKDGIKVSVGDRVRTGDPIALSGNTGFSSGPHLHFSVFKTKSGKERESIPVRFRTADAGVVTLQSGKKHTAASVGPIAVQATARATDI